jgi:DNA repair protein RadC
MNPERSAPEQLSFLAPEDVELVQLMRYFLAEASRIYETRPGAAPTEPLAVTCPADAYRLLAPELAHLPQEQLRVLTLNIKNHVVSAPMIYQGTVSATHVRIGEVFRPAIVDHASGIIVAHNHPSGDPSPSADDMHLTAQLVAAGRLLDIAVHDHLIVGRDRFVSLRETGLTPFD